MRVQSPVGQFPVHVVGIGLRHGRPTVEIAMGAWRSRVWFERTDVPLIAAVLLLLASVFAAGRRSASRP
jgi:hypothetical protein